MTPLQTTIGWVGCVLFFWACWLMGGNKMANRRDGIFWFVCVNVCFGVQAYTLENWSLVVMSVGGAVLQLRAWARWEYHDDGLS